MDFLKELNPKQREAVEALDGVVMISAGAGSGKTKVLTCRIARLIQKGVAPYHILGITFTNKAAKEMKSRLNEMVGSNTVTLRTFHGLCVTILKQEVLEEYEKKWTIAEPSKCKTLMKNLLEELNSKYKPDTVLQQVSKIKEMGYTPKQWHTQVDNMLIPEGGERFYKDMADLYEKYQKVLIKNDLMDFDDLLLNTVELLRTVPEAREYYQNKYQYILVDEYQDTNHIQYELIKLLYSKNLCVVGDADQSIYGWRGADESNISDFPKDFPDYKLILLEQNYRSTSVILEAANAVISNNEGRIKKNLWTDKGKGDPIFYRTLYSGFEEGNYIADYITELHTIGTPYKDIAVLYRMNSQSRQIEDSLRNSHIPYTVIGNVRFYDRKEIKDVLAYLNLFANSNDTISLLRAICTPKRGIGKKVFEAAGEYSREHDCSLADALQSDDLNIPDSKKKIIQEFFTTMYECADAPDIAGFIQNIIVKFKLKENILKENKNSNEEEIKERYANLDELVASARLFMEEDGEHGIDEFLNQIALLSDADAENRMDGVSLMTIHAAKGLEFPVVFLPGLENGIFPNYNVLNSGDVEHALKEERRLMYVAITRAKELLFLSNAEERMTFTGIQRNEPSLFLQEIPPELLK